MTDRLERRHRLTANPLRWTVGQHQIGMLLLEGLQFGQQQVIFAVADLGRGLGVILPVVMPDLLTQAFDLLDSRGGHGWCVSAVTSGPPTRAAARLRLCRSPSKWSMVMAPAVAIASTTS